MSEPLLPRKPGENNADYMERLTKFARSRRYEDALAFQLRGVRSLDGWVREYKFHPERQWKLDFAWPAIKVAVEIEGISGGNGTRHQRAAGFRKDLEKYNAAVMLGWRVLRFPQDQVNSGEALNTIEEFIGDECEEANQHLSRPEVADTARAPSRKKSSVRVLPEEGL